MTVECRHPQGCAVGAWCDRHYHCAFRGQQEGKSGSMVPFRFSTAQYPLCITVNRQVLYWMCSEEVVSWFALPMSVEGYGPSIPRLVAEVAAVLADAGRSDEIADFEVRPAYQYGWHVRVTLGRPIAPRPAPPHRTP